MNTTVCSFITPSASPSQHPGSFTSRMSCVHLRGLSGPLRSIPRLQALPTFSENRKNGFFFPALDFVSWLTDKLASISHNEHKQAWALLTGRVWELRRRTSKDGESDSWSSSWPGPPDKIRVTGEHGTLQVPLSHPSTLPAASIWPLADLGILTYQFLSDNSNCLLNQASELAHIKAFFPRPSIDQILQGILIYSKWAWFPY